MELKKILFAITGLLFLMSVPAAAGRSPLVTDIPAEPTKSIRTFELIRNSIFLADNESQSVQSGNQSTDENKEQSSESGAEDEEKSGNISNEAETKNIKPFKPSEEIAAEQAVDFPVDI